MDKRSSATYVLALSIFCLSGAFVFFTIELSRVTQQIPVVLSSIEATGQKTQLMVEKISQISGEIPPILAEVKQVREKIPSILEEVKQVRQQIPPVLEEVKQVRQQIPPVLKEVKQVRQQIPPLLEEVRNTRPVVTKAIDEVANTREAIPPMLVQAEKIVNDMHDIGQNTSEGAVTGVFTGILKAPFKIVGGIGEAIFGLNTKEIQELTQMDEELMIEAIDALVTTNKIGKTLNWANAESGNEGAITFKEKEMIDAQECLVLHFVIRIKGKVRANTDVTLCLNDESEWEVYEE